MEQKNLYFQGLVSIQYIFLKHNFQTWNFIKANNRPSSIFLFDDDELAMDYNISQVPPIELES